MQIEISNSAWAQSIQPGEIFEEFGSQNLANDVLSGAYDAYNKFCQKQIKRSKISKRKGQCWQ